MVDVETHSESVSVNEAARFVDLTPRRLQQLAASGVIEKDGRGRYNLIKLVRGYVKYLRDQIPGAAVDQNSERARLIKAKRVAQEMENAVRRGQLTLREDENREAMRQARDARLALEAIPDRIAPELAAESDELKIHTMMLDEMRRVFDGLYRIELERKKDLEALAADEPDSENHEDDG